MDPLSAGIPGLPYCNAKAWCKGRTVIRVPCERFWISSISAAVWLAVKPMQTLVHSGLCSSADLCLFNFAAGLQFFALLVGGVWAAAGFCCADCLCLVFWDRMSPADAAVLSVLLQLPPFALLKLASTGLKLRPDLANLKHWHLPVLAVATAVGTSAAVSAAAYRNGVPLDYAFLGLARVALEGFSSVLLVVSLVFVGLKLAR